MVCFNIEIGYTQFQLYPHHFNYHHAVTLSSSPHQEELWIRPVYQDPDHEKQTNVILSLVKKVTNSFLFLLATVYERMLHCGFFEDFPDSQLFPSVHDAVLYAQQSEKS